MIACVLQGALDAEETEKIKELFEEEARVKQLQRKMKSEEAEYNSKSQHLDELKKEIHKNGQKLNASRPTLEVEHPKRPQAHRRRGD